MIKRIPKNSVTLIVKFKDPEKLDEFLKTESYKEALHKLSVSNGSLEVITTY